tara:strand:- start:370 stop:558 length:189 start_codon:yes stop_codon:yes gene_type:complete
VKLDYKFVYGYKMLSILLGFFSSKSQNELNTIALNMSEKLLISNARQTHKCANALGWMSERK